MNFLVFFPFLSTLWAGPVMTSSSIETKEMSQVLAARCERILRGYKTLNVRSSRFYVNGKGYLYRVRVEGFQNIEQAQAIAEKLLPSLSGLQLILDSGKELTFSTESNTFVAQDSFSSAKISSTAEEQQHISTVVDNENVTGKELAKDADGLNPAKEEMKASKGAVPMPTDVLALARKNLLGFHNYLQTAETEHIVFNRSLYNDEQLTLMVNHKFWRKGIAMRLEVTIASGEGVDSTTVLSPDGRGWVLVGENSVEKTASKIQHVLSRFSVSQIFSVLHDFPKDIETNGPWRQLDQVEKKGDCWVLSKEVPSKSGIESATFCSEKMNLENLVLRNSLGTTEYRYYHFQPFGDLGSELPLKFEIFENNKLIEKIDMKSLTIGDKVATDLFKSLSDDP